MIRKKQNKKFVASLLALLVLSSCSKVTPKHFNGANFDFNTNQKDVQLNVKQAKADDLIKRMSANSDMKTGELFRSILGLYILADKYNKPAFKALANGIDNQFYSTMNSTAKIKLEESPFVQAVLGMGKKYIDAGPVILNLFDGKTAKYSWPQNVKLADVGGESIKFGEWVTAQLKTAKVDDSIVTALKENVFDKILAARQGNIDDSLSSVTASTTASDKMSYVSDLLDTLMLDLENAKLASLKSYIASATALATKIDAIADQATSSAALTDAKKILNPDELSKIKATATPDELKTALIQVLESTTIAKIEKAAATVSLPDLPNQIISLLSSQVGIEPVRLRALLANPVTELKKIVAEFGSTQLASAPAGINGIESDSVHLVIQAGSLKMAAGTAEAQTKTSAEAIGSSISKTITLVADAEKQTNTDVGVVAAAKSAIITQLNKLVLMCGFKTADGKIASYTTAQDDANTPVIILDDANQSSKVMAVPDGVTLAKNLTPTAVDKSVSVRGQASLLKGLSDLISYLRDWEQNGFDKGLGSITGAEILNIDPAKISVVDLQTALNKPVFDKSLMFAFAIKNAATILQNTKKELSPFYLMSPTEAPVWLNELPLKDANGKEIPDTRATAGLVDLVNGQRGSITRTGDLARYMIALSSFLKATDGIEQTKSADVQKNLEQLTKAREDIKTLITALSFMLTHNLEQEDGSIADQFDKVQLKASGQANAVDTALAIEAMVRSAEVLNAKGLNDAAEAAYFAMNKNMWSDELQFYAQDQKKTQMPAYDELISILNSINVLAPHLPEDSHKQWNSIANNWVEVLELLANSLQTAKH